MNLLDIKNLSVRFGDANAVPVVDGLDLSVAKGEVLAIVGESGSGKSVTMMALMGLIDAPGIVSADSLQFDGTDMLRLKGRQRRHIVGKDLSMVFQDPMTALNPVMRIGRQITESLLHHTDIGKGAANETALALLQSVGIPEAERRLRQYPHELSGGMRQRVMIAIALACGPKLLFADEPTTALDVTVQAQILDLLQDQQRERFMAMILVTHDLGVVAGRADDIAVMYAGRIVEKAPTRTLFREMRHPYSEALLESIPKLEAPNHTRLAAIGGRPPDLVNLPPGCKFAPRCPNVQEKCLKEEPPLIEHGTPGHEYACYFPVGSREGAEARARNVAASRNVPGTVAAGGGIA